MHASNFPLPDDPPLPPSPTFSDSGLIEITIDELKHTSAFYNDFYASYTPGLEELLLASSVEHPTASLNSDSIPVHTIPNIQLAMLSAAKALASLSGQSSSIVERSSQPVSYSAPPPSSQPARVIHSTHYGPPLPSSQPARLVQTETVCSSILCKKLRNKHCTNRMCKTHCLTFSGCSSVSDHKPPMSTILSSQPAPSTSAKPPSNTSEHPSNPHCSTSKPPSTSEAHPPPNCNVQHYTQVASDDHINIEAAHAMQRAERAEVDSINKLASTEVVIYGYTS